jgi:hypothetical protein
VALLLSLLLALHNATLPPYGTTEPGDPTWADLARMVQGRMLAGFVEEGMTPAQVAKILGSRPTPPAATPAPLPGGGSTGRGGSACSSPAAR